MPLSIPFGSLGLSLISCGLTATVVGNAFYQKKQFYPSVVYITKSNPSMAAIYLMAFTVVILFGKLLKKIFFGTLRAAESEHLIERFFYAVTETCLAFTVFRDDFSPKFVALFTVLLFLKAFHWLADYRVDYMERSPVITRIFHIRVASLLILLSAIDILLIRHAYHSTMSLGASVQLVFGFEYAILLTVAYNIGVKYICHGIELQSDNTWENKAMYLLYTELFVGLVKVLLYLAFLFIMVRIHTFPLFIIRPMYLTMKSFKRALQDILHSRRAIHAMNTQYPNATEEDLRTSDTVCIICRDEMLLNTDVKKLPCNHLFHANCLRSWFQRQQTCPTCRLDILRDTPPRNTPTAPNAPAAAANNNNQGQAPQPGARRPMHIMDFMQQMMDQVQARNNQQQNNNNNNNAAPAANNNPPQANPPPNTNANLFPFVPPQLFQVIRQNAGNNTAPSSATNAPGTSSTSFTIPPFPPMPGAFPPMAGAFPPIPPLPRDFGPLTDQELKAMEGRQREHIIKRLQMLQNVTTLINASIIQLQQYNTLMANLDISMPVPQSSTPEASTSKPDSKPFKNTADSSSSTSSSQQKDDSAASNSKTQPDQPSSSADANPDSSSSSNGVTSTSQGEGSSTGDNAEEVRRRRLERFVASSH